jgi:hypothetical protein
LNWLAIYSNTFLCCSKNLRVCSCVRGTVAFATVSAIVAWATATLASVMTGVPAVPLASTPPETHTFPPVTGATGGVAGGVAGGGTTGGAAPVTGGEVLVAGGVAGKVILGGGSFGNSVVVVTVVVVKLLPRDGLTATATSNTVVEITDIKVKAVITQLHI